MHWVPAGLHWPWQAAPCSPVLVLCNQELYLAAAAPAIAAPMAPTPAPALLHYYHSNSQPSIEESHNVGKNELGCIIKLCVKQG